MRGDSTKKRPVGRSSECHIRAQSAYAVAGTFYAAGLPVGLRIVPDDIVRDFVRHLAALRPEKSVGELLCIEIELRPEWSGTRIYVNKSMHDRAERTTRDDRQRG